MWTKIINYKRFVRYSVQMGAKIEDSVDHKLGALILGIRKDRYIFRLDKMLLNYFFNKVLINKIAFTNANFLFLTSRREYYSTIRANADLCSQTALLWSPAALGDLKIRTEILDELYDSDNPISRFHTKSYPVPNVFVLFDNEKFKSKRLMGEVTKFLGVPLFSVMDTDSIVQSDIFPIMGNDDSSVSIYFYSFFVAHSILSVRKSAQLISDEKAENSK